jgi:DNA repair protein RadC
MNYTKKNHNRNHHESLENPVFPSKRVEIVKIKLVRESSFLYGKRRVNSPVEAYELGKVLMEETDREHLLVCCLDTKNQPINLHVVSIGSLNSSIIHPREIFKAAILSNAASIILYHNHPSGDPTPSSEDLSATERIRECGKLMGIDLLDHLILGENTYYSMREKGDL